MRPDKGRPKPYAPAKRTVHPVFDQMRRRRIERGLTHEDLAGDCGYSVSAIKSAEIGVSRMRMQTFFDVCDVLGVDIRLVPKE